MLPPKYKLSGTNDCAHKCHKIPRKAAINSLLSNALKRMYASELSIIANWLENLQKKKTVFRWEFTVFRWEFTAVRFSYFPSVVERFSYATICSHEQTFLRMEGMLERYGISTKHNIVSKDVAGRTWESPVNDAG